MAGEGPSPVPTPRGERKALCPGSPWLKRRWYFQCKHAEEVLLSLPFFLFPPTVPQLGAGEDLLSCPFPEPEQSLLDACPLWLCGQAALAARGPNWMGSCCLLWDAVAVTICLLCVQTSASGDDTPSQACAVWGPLSLQHVPTPLA